MFLTSIHRPGLARCYAPDDGAAGGVDPALEPVEEAAPEFTLPEDFAQTVQGWDVPVDKLAEAVELYKGLQTEDGVIDNFTVLGQKLGFGMHEMERLFLTDEELAQQLAKQAAPFLAPAPVASTAPVEPEDPERLMTAAEVRALVEAERATSDSRFSEFQQQQVEAQQQAFQARQTQTFAAIGEWFKTNDIVSEEAQAIIARLGEKTLDPTADSYDPQVAIAALERGKEAYDKFVETEAEARLRKKAVVAGAQPASIGEGGGTDAGDGDTAPDYKALGGDALVAAKKRVRERLMQG